MDIKAVIIDDEPHNIENLQGILEKWCKGVEVVATATSADDGIAVIKEAMPQIVFLDIQMPDKSGFDVLTAFSEISFEVIFITAYDHYGIQAIKFSALDYLLKPVDIAELQRAVEKATMKLDGKQQNQSIENLLAFFKKSQQDFPKIALPTTREIRYVRVNEIVRCEASNNYTTFYLQNSDEILVCKTLKEFSELLKPYGFHRTHQTHLVNFQYVKSLLKEDGGKLLLENQIKIPISRQNLETVKRTLSGTG